ncbi:pyridoxamine 5'-phosphate oxidase family protein [Blastopirellula sp. JC732]|uniref:Pyridoxamine 5'-phosphate oxidase family protein n=1 Tax=Blastopirellula sediminis TaxID=2894196 RepID=A0A9X1MPL0_9BACT|nr:pyridoxamine 5'-phosphate oxidase family protein [Blastopirellula sediminis]MCC9606595.1 pyridoxamine 5'-phosphate oxidase family protein [Blastopirellula sediminis]MCC9630107.1 pyridoxamine 5'-phosphate oxidase family protein [Blastopirellula sediminis]
MGKIYETIEDRVAQFIRQQKLFFVATAPLAEDGLINLSPKGLDSFRILDEKTVAYLDLTGSGIETIAHAKENGRITVMFCSFEGAPNILRLYGQAEVLEPDHADFASLRELFPHMPGTRSIIRIHVSRISDSCGYAVPKYQFVEDRSTLIDYCVQKGPQGLADYRREKNATSLDGLKGLDNFEGDPATAES